MPAQSSIAAAVLLCFFLAAAAAEWRGAPLSWRIGNKFGEPFNRPDIRNNILALTRASGYKYGANHFNVDLLQSDSSDPGSLTQRSGAHEACVAYRHMLDIGKRPRPTSTCSSWLTPPTRRAVSKTCSGSASNTSSGTTNSAIPRRPRATGAAAPARRWSAPRYF